MEAMLLPTRWAQTQSNEVALIGPRAFTASDPRMQVFHDRIREGYSLARVVGLDNDLSRLVMILQKPVEQTGIVVVSR